MATGTDTIVDTELFIDGAWRPSTSGRRYELHNPARPAELVGRAAAAGPEDVDRAVQAAHRAFPAWSALSFRERASYLLRVAERLADDASDVEARIRLLTREHGKILEESRLEITRLGDRFRGCAAFAERLEAPERLDAPPFDTIVLRQPRGVAALVTPWNWPLSILGAKLPQALLAGNTVVVKLSERASLAPALTTKRIAEVFPPGVVNVVTGSGPEVGEPLLRHRLVRTINFTGGTETGRRVMKIAADTLKNVTLELGGNDPALVLEDAELDEPALRRMALGAFLTAGQVCMALKRLYVHRSRYRELVDGLAAIVDETVVGDGLDPAVTMGPLNNERQRDWVRGLVDDARRRGARVVELGKVADETLFARGYFHRPTLVTDADPGLDVVRCEQFGPVLPIVAFDDEDEAVRMANETEFGLCSSVWTRDRDRALAVARRLEAGYTYLNAHGPMAQDGRAPFGGFKQSGIGRNLGFDGVLAFLEPHAVSAAPGFLPGA